MKQPRQTPTVRNPRCRHGRAGDCSKKRPAYQPAGKKNSGREMPCPGLTRRRYAVRMPVSFGSVAQLVEQRTENPCVGGSIPPLPTSCLFSTSQPFSSRLNLLCFELSKPRQIPPNCGGEEPERGMSCQINRPPKFCREKHQALVRIAGKRVYLGHWGACRSLLTHHRRRCHPYLSRLL